jgi:hypothetical protein
MGRLSLETTLKVALGSTHEVLTTSGITNQNITGFLSTIVGLPSGQFPSGIYVQPSNTGRFAQDRFAVLPEGELKIGFDITGRIRATIGYDFIYWSDVLRPGNQIDRVINISQTTGALWGNVPGGGGGALVGPARPQPLMKTSDFWAQGISFGLEFRF